MDESLIHKLLELNKEIEKRKQEKSRLQGKLDTLLNTLKKETGCTTIEEAIVFKDNLEKRLMVIETDLTTLLQEIESKL